MILNAALSLLLLYLLQACGTVEIEGEERILACPRDVIQYACHVGYNSCVTWNLRCPGRETPFSPTTSGDSCNGSEQFSCSSNGVVTMFNVEVTYSNSELNSGPHSNITIQMLNSSIPENGLTNMRIDCEDSRKYRYLSFAAVPPVPENFSYMIKNSCNNTHLPTVLTWTTVTSTSQLQGSTITYVLDIVTDSTTVETNTSTVTVYLKYGRTYNIHLYASTCQSELTSDPVSLRDVTIGKYTSILESINSGLLVFNITSSSFSFKCPEGKDAVSTVCREDGRWDPDPSSHMCSTGTQESDPQPLEISTIIGITSGVVILLLISLAVGTAIAFQRLRLKSSRKTATAESPEDTVVYEEINNSYISHNSSDKSCKPQRQTDTLTDGQRSTSEEGATAVNIPPPATSSAPTPSDDMAATERGDIHMSENVAYVTTTVKGGPSVVTGDMESQCVSVANVLYEGLPAEAAGN